MTTQPAEGGGAGSDAPKHNHIASATGLGGATTTRSTPDFLVLVLDCNLLGWAAAASASAKGSQGQNGNANGDAISGKGAASELEKVLKDVLIFLNAHMALQHGNGVAVYAASGAKSKLLFSSAPHSSSAALAQYEEEDEPDANTFQEFKILDSRVYAGIKGLLQSTAEEVDDFLKRQQEGMDVDGAEESEARRAEREARRSALSSAGIVAALSQALCHVNRLSISTYSAIAPGASATARATSQSGNRSGGSERAGNATYRSRILILSVTPDSSTAYVPMMNCIFGAQKAMVPVHVCKLHGTDSVFLQQACFLTHGSYLRVKNRLGLLQTLMSTFLATSASASKLLNLLNDDQVDFRAACFCHREIVDVGYVCSVCLSIFCSPLERCMTCKSRFPRRTLERLRSEHKLLEIAGVATSNDSAA